MVDVLNEPRVMTKSWNLLRPIEEDGILIDGPTTSVQVRRGDELVWHRELHHIFHLGRHSLKIPFIIQDIRENHLRQQATRFALTQGK